MKRLGKKAWTAIALGSFVAAVTVIAFSSRPTTPVAPHPSKETLARWKLQNALREASVKELIQHARVAARKGDDQTHRALVAGLKREPDRARALLANEIAKTTDSNDLTILNRMISELP